MRRVLAHCLMAAALAGCVSTPSLPAPTAARTLPAPHSYRAILSPTVTPGEPRTPQPSQTPLPESLEEMARSVYGERLVQQIEAPTIGVRAPVRPVGWDAQSVTDLPEWDNPEAEVGWVVSSALPGDDSAIILYGHNNIHSSVFQRLANLKAGDVIRLQTGAGAWQYRVQRVEIVAVSGPDEDQAAYRRVFEPQPEASLVLLSCWPPDNNTHRVIVTATPDFAPVQPL